MLKTKTISFDGEKKKKTFYGGMRNILSFTLYCY